MIDAGLALFFTFHFSYTPPGMRTCLTFLLAIMLSLNAAYAAAGSICVALEHLPNHAVHFGHHSHEHSDDRVVQSADQDKGGKVSPVGNQHHDHAHPGYSSILTGIISVMPLTGCSPLVAAPANAFVSAPQTLPDPPPRTKLA